MKKVTILFFFVILTFLASIQFTNAQTTIWSEDFNNPADDGVGATGPIPIGTNTGVTSPTSGKWSVDVTKCQLTFNNDYFRVKEQLFEARNVDGTQQPNGSGDGAIWTSESIDISEYTDVIISVDISKHGNLEHEDFIKASYKIYGDTIVFGHVYGNFVDQTFQVTGLSGSSLIIFIEVDNDSGGERIQFDNVIIEGTIQEITKWIGTAKSTDWNDPDNWDNGVPNAGLGATIPDVSKAPFPIITGSATCNNLFIYAGASLEIGPTGALTVNCIFTNNGTLTIKSDENGTGSLIESSGVNATVERYYTGGEWHLISAPISGATANMFLGLYLQYHTESTNQYTDITDPGAGLNVMQGYALWNNINATAQFIGTLNTGSYGSANNLTRSGTPPPPEDTLGWNLMGNPYPSSIDWNASPGWTKTNMNATIYIEASGNWATWNGTAGTNGGTRYIAPGQGYFVEVTANQSLGTLICNNSVRIHNPTTFFKNTVSNMVRLLAEGNGKTDETVILFDEDATEEFDGNYDAHKFFAYDVSYPQIYSIADKNIAINTLPETEWVQLGFKAGISGKYTISATEINDISSVWLEDTFTGVFTNLTVDSYSFSYTVDENEDRFIVHFTPLAVDENAEEIFNIYSYGNEVYVSVPENTKGNIVIYNIIGQEVTNAPINNVLNKITLEKSAYYIVKVLSDESTVAKKVFIK